MKALKILTIAFLTMLIGMTAVAQKPVATKTYYKSTDNRNYYFHTNKWYVANEQKQGLKTTTDSAFYYIDTISVADNESGILEVQLLGYNDSLSIAITGKKIVRYKKVAGTLTLGTATDVLATEVDTGLQNTSLGGAAWTITSANNQIYIRIKGKTPYKILWESLRTLQKRTP